MAATYWEETWKRVPGERAVPLLDERSELALSVSRPGERVLDLGCGDGFFTSVIAGAGAEAIGVDVAEQALERAGKSYPQLDFVKALPDERLPLDDCGFDAVFCSEVINQVVDTQLFFSEARRVLRPGGCLALTTPYHGRLKSLLTALFGFERHHSPFEPQLRFYTKQMLGKLLDEFSFDRIEIWTVGGPPVLRRALFARARREESSGLKSRPCGRR